MYIGVLPTFPRLTYTSLMPLLGLGVVGFCLCTVPRLHYPVLLASTAVVGATAFVLGIDCFTTAGLKEVCMTCHCRNATCVTYVCFLI